MLGDANYVMKKKEKEKVIVVMRENPVRSEIIESISRLYKSIQLH